MIPELARQELHGPIAWMTRHRVAPNLLMVVLLVGGLLTTTRIKQEVFPEFETDIVVINVPYPGASPEEVEKGIVLALEEAVRGLDGIKEISATAAEGAAMVRAELIEGTNRQQAYQDIKQEVDRITTLPEEAEEPRVMLEMRRREVLDLLVYGDLEERVLRVLAEQVRDRLLQDAQITQVDIFPSRQYEIGVEVAQENLRAYNLTLDAIAARIRQAALELPGGSVKTEGGEILLRMTERRDYARQFARLPILTAPDGTQLYLDDIATVSETFEETYQLQSYEGHPCVTLSVYRVGDQTPIGVSDAVRQATERLQAEMPPGVHLTINNDRSEIYRQRLEMLLRNGCLGIVLVLAVLGLFLEFRLAFWVMMGIPISFLGGLLILPTLDVSINMISMFAFIIALGIVVDDAIVAGENIYEYRQSGMKFIPAAVLGARDVSVPIAFAVLTNIAAFLPLAFIPGVIGKIFRVIPAVVVTVFAISWVESLLILPAHLGHTRAGGRSGVALGGFFHRQQQRFSRGCSRFAEHIYGSAAGACLRHRYLTVATCIAVLALTIGYIKSGRMGLELMPRAEADVAIVTAVLPYGSPLSRTLTVRDRLTAAVNNVVQTHGGKELAEGVLGSINDNQVTVSAYLTEPDRRPISTVELTRLWRERVGTIPGLESLRFESDRGGPGSGAALTVELSHGSVDVLDRASQALAAELAQFSHTKDIDDGYTPGKEQFDFEMRPEGRSLGLTSYDVARQLRSAFYGAEALRQQRGRNEVKVMVRLPKEQRVRAFDVEEFIVRTAAGRDVPLREVARLKPSRAYTNITRRDGRRTVLVTADVDPPKEAQQIIDKLNGEILPLLTSQFPGLTYAFEGRQADLRESLSSLYLGFALALLLIFTLLAIPFRSYTQPLVVMTSIPFGIFGAVVGHWLMGYSLSVMSMMGIVALSGVVVNDALILIVYANQLRANGSPVFEATRSAGVRRFRPIILTTLTTFGGLAPMIFETSRQARFMIPMALSLGFGIVFATVITLLLVPCLYLIVDDGHRAAAWLKGHEEADPNPATA